MSEKTTGMGHPIGQPSICLIKQSLDEKTDCFVNFFDNFLKIFFIGVHTFQMYAIVLVTGIQVKSDYMSQEAYS